MAGLGGLDDQVDHVDYYWRIINTRGSKAQGSILEQPLFGRSSSSSFLAKRAIIQDPSGHYWLPVAIGHKRSPFSIY